MTIKFTKIVSAHGPLTKRLSLNADGGLQKEAAAQLYRGQYSVVSVNNLSEFAEHLESATPNTALTYGVTDQPSGTIVREEDLIRQPGAIARTREFFTWPQGPGILMIDDDSGLMVDSFVDFLRDTVPFLESVDLLERPSSSSMIKNADTNEWVRCVVNRRAYAIVSDARMITEVGRLVEAYLWRANCGYFDISKSGRLLKRCPADTSVWQPERLDFVGGAVCVAPLVQDRLHARLSDGGSPMVDVRRLPKLTERDKAVIRALEEQARQRIEDARMKIRQEYLDSRIHEMVQRGTTPEIAQMTLQSAMEQQSLSGEFILTLQDGSVVTVAQILAEPGKYHGKRCHDPLEPDYHNDPRVAYISLMNGCRPYVFSHAHGGCRYQLNRPAKIIQLESGESAKATDQIATELAKEGLLYERGQLLVTLQDDGGTKEVKPAAVKYLAGTHCNLQRFDRRSNGLRPADLPDSVAQLLVTRTGHGVFKRLSAVITAPTMTPSGRLITKPGYDLDTRLLLIVNGEVGLPVVSSRPNDAAIRAAFDHLWHAFKDFPFDGNESRSAMIAALLTAVVRPCLLTAPGFGFDAPTAGSGKTKLAQCVAALATGAIEGVLPPPADDEETRKKITTAIAATKQVMLYDNIEAPVKSSALAAFLTSATWSDRMLGGNTEVQGDNRVLLLLSGNNLTPEGDLIRRLLMVRIDPRVEASAVWQREFDLEPLDYVVRNRQRLVAAALTLLSGFVAVGMPRQVKGRLASFEQWDNLVRQCVIWLGTLGVGNLVDPVKRLNEAASNDPETMRLGQLASTWYETFGAAPQFLKDVVQVPKLQDSLREVAQDRSGCINTKMLSTYLSKRAGKIIGGFSFERKPGRSNTLQWRVVPHTGE